MHTQLIDGDSPTPDSRTRQTAERIFGPRRAALLQSSAELVVVKELAER